ncbi:MAG: hypothetical protein Q8R15_04095 [Candidatus Micrarchaeota archaeon]|nr:hypothetical protein [Candidatus Micrarchaeota archaeon]
MSAHSSQGKSLNISNFLLYLLLIGGVALLFSNFVSGQVFEDVETRDVNAAIPSSYVDVGGNVDFSTVLPGHNYSRDLLVSLNLPFASLNGLKSSNVTVFVKLSTLKGEGSAISFEVDGKQSRYLRFSMVCIVRNSTCVEGSILLKSVKVLFAAPSTGYPYVDQVVVNSSLELVPLSELEEKAAQVLAQVAEAEKKLNEVKNSIKITPFVINPSGNFSNFSNELDAVNRSLQEASLYASALNVSEAENALNKAQSGFQFLQNASGSSPVGAKSSQTGLFTGGIFGSNVFNLAELALLLSFAFVILCVYIYRKGRSDKKKNIDVDKFMRDND